VASYCHFEESQGFDLPHPMMLWLVNVVAAAVVASTKIHPAERGLSDLVEAV